MVLESYGIAEWVEEEKDVAKREFREAVHTILSAISNDPGLRADMVIKGGILLAVRYHSDRYTKDIDFSTNKKLDEIEPKQITETLNRNFLQAAERLGYDLDCRVQSCRAQPANKPDALFPSVKIKVGYAYKV